MLLQFLISLIGLTFLFVNFILFSLKIKGKETEYKYLTLYLFILALVETFCHIIGWLHPGDNLFLSHYYFNIQFFLLSLFFLKLFQEKKQKKLVLIGIVLVPLIVGASYINNPKLYYLFNIIEITATTVPLLVYIIIYNLNTISEQSKYYHFTIGLSIYLLNSCYIFLSGNTEVILIKDPYIDIWVFNSLFYIIYQYFIFKNWKKITLTDKVSSI